jgi:putative inorganic carbon (hco3(-)) transporter
LEAGGLHLCRRKLMKFSHSPPPAKPPTAAEPTAVSGVAPSFQESSLGREFLQFWALVASLVFQPYFYLLIYIVVLYLRPQEYIDFFLGKPVVPVTLITATLLWMVGQKKQFEAPQHFLMVGLTASIFISVLLTGWLMGALNALTDFLPTLLLFYIVATSTTTLKRLQGLAIVMTAVCVVIAFHGMGQIEDEFGVGWTGAEMIDNRITYLGFLNDPNDLSMAFLMVLPLTLYVAQVGSFWLLRLSAYASMAVILYGVFLCNSRGSLLGIAAMLFAYAVRRFGWLRSTIVAPMLLVPLLLLAPSRVSEMAADEESAAGRWDAWFEGFEMLKSHPLFGIGKGLFADHNGLTAHNSFVLSFAETGLIGYFFWFSILVLTALMLVRLMTAIEPGTLPKGNFDKSLAPLAAVLPWTADAEPGQANHLGMTMNAAPAPPPESAGEPAPVFPTEVDSNVLAAAVEEAFSWNDMQIAARMLMYSLIGTMVAAFFLSRSYVVFLYVLFGVIVGMFQLARVRWPEIAPVRLGDVVGRILLLMVGSMIFLWFLTRLLLSLS